MVEWFLDWLLVMLWNHSHVFLFETRTVVSTAKKICCNQFLWLQQHHDWWKALQRHPIARTHSSEGRASHCFFFSLTCQVAQKIRLGNSRMRFPIYFPSALCIVAMVSLIQIIMVRDRQPLHLGHLLSGRGDIHAEINCRKCLLSIDIGWYDICILDDIRRKILNPSYELGKIADLLFSHRNSDRLPWNPHEIPWEIFGIQQMEVRKRTICLTIFYGDVP